MTNRMPIALLFLVAALGNLAYWAFTARPQEAGPGINGPLKSVSFAPFRKGQSPLTQTYPPASQIEEDIQLLKGLTRGLRTYTSQEGMENVPPLAAKHGFKVTHSAWLGTTKATNENEVDALIKAANQYPEVIERVIVGNEVLLRRDLKPEELIAHINKVKQSIKQPVSYADVWAFYLKHPEVGHAVDFLTIHILPYWEDEPVGIEGVGAHIKKIHDQMKAAFPGKPILIGEAGWPTIGRQRGPADPGVVNSAKHARQLVEVAEREGFDYNLVEAFDQYWKSKLEGTVGARWGIVGDDRKPKFPLTGKVVENPNWLLGFELSLVLGLVGCLPFVGRLRKASGNAAFAFVAMAQILAVLFVLTAQSGFSRSYFLDSEIGSYIWTVLTAGFAVLLLKSAADSLSSTSEGGCTTSQALANMRNCRYSAHLRRALVLLFLFCALLQTAAIVVDGRYRDIPVSTFLVPIWGMVVLGLVRFLANGGREGLAGAFALGGRFAAPPTVGELKFDRWLVWACLGLSVLNILAEGRAIVGEDFTKTHPSMAEQAPLILQAMFSSSSVLIWSLMLLLAALPFAANLAQAKQG
jgi:exo-beta-1,3-glucanase (GH17 family)